MTREEFVEELIVFQNRYKKELKFGKHSKNTIESYNNTIKSFIEFVSEYDLSLSYEKIRPGTIIDFLIYKETKFNEKLNSSNDSFEMENETKNLYIIHLKRFFNYIESEHFELNLDFDKLFKDKRLKFPTKKRKPKNLTQDDEKRLLDYLASKIEVAKKYKLSKQLVAYRNSLVIKIALYSGARVSEIIDIKLSKIEEEDGLLLMKIIGKGNKEDYLIILKDNILEEYTFFKELGKDRICITTQDKIMDRKQIWLMIDKIYRELNINRIGFHGLRHTLAKKVYQESKDILLVQNLLRHSSVKTTTIYADRGLDVVKDDYRKLHFNKN